MKTNYGIAWKVIAVLTLIAFGVCDVFKAEHLQRFLLVLGVTWSLAALVVQMVIERREALEQRDANFRASAADHQRP